MYFSDFDRTPNSLADGWLERLSIRGGRPSSVNNEDNPTITELNNRSGYKHDFVKTILLTYSLAHQTQENLNRGSLTHAVKGNSWDALCSVTWVCDLTY